MVSQNNPTNQNKQNHDEDLIKANTILQSKQ